MLNKKKEKLKKDSKDKEKSGKLEKRISLVFLGVMLTIVIVTLSGVMVSIKTFTRQIGKKVTDDITKNEVHVLEKDLPQVAHSLESVIEPHKLVLDILSTKQNPQGDFNDTLDAMLGSSEDIDLVYVAMTDGSLYAKPPTQPPQDYKAVETQWYKKAIENKNQVVAEGPYIDTAKDQLVITIAKTVTDNKGGVLGVLAADIDLSAITSTIENTEIGAGGYLVLADSEGQIVSVPEASQDQIKPGQAFPVESAREFAKSQEEIFKPIEQKHDNGENHFLAGYNLSDIDLTLFGILPDTEIVNFSNHLIDETTNSLKGSLLVILLIISITVALIILFMRKHIRKLVLPIGIITKAVTGLAIGEYDRFVPESEDDTEIGYLIRATSSVQEGLKNIVGNVANTADGLGDISSNLDTTIGTISTAFNDISSAINQIAEGTTMQAMDVEDTTNLIMSISDEIEHISDLSQKLGQSADEVNQVRLDSVNTIEELASTSEATREEFARVSEDVNKLIESANHVTDAARIIEDINEQTHLLSLNASIEAARAGDAGNGFAVVADEIRKLSENVLESTKEINQNISNIHTQIEGVVDKIGSLDEVINLQSNASSHVDDAFKHIGESIDIIRHRIDESDKAVQKVIESKDETTERMQNISVVIEEIAASSEEVSAVSESQNNNIKEVDGIVQNLVNQYDILSDNLESLGYKRNE